MFVKNIFISTIKKNLFLVLLSSFIACKSDPNGPEESQLGRRDYTWMVDTIRVPMSDLTRLWGSSYDNVWVSGHTASYGTNLYHFIGSLWTWDGEYRKVMPFSIFGFGPNDVWMGGQGLDIWHYDGIWKKTAVFDSTGHGNSAFMDIWGDSPDNVYAIGLIDSLDNEKAFRTGVICHYDGKDWSRVKIPDMPYQFSRIRRGISENNKYYIFANEFINYNTDTLRIFEFDGKNLKPILTGFPNWNEGIGVFEIGKKLYFVQGSKIFKYRNEKFELFFENPLPNHAIAIWGRNEKDIFLAMQDGIAHYNGNDISYIYRFSNNYTSIYDYICLDNSVFVLAFDNLLKVNVVIRGKLNN